MMIDWQCIAFPILFRKVINLCISVGTGGGGAPGPGPPPISNVIIEGALYDMGPPNIVYMYSFFMVRLCRGIYWICQRRDLSIIL